MGESADRVRNYVATHELTVPVLVDPDMTVTGEYGVRATPTRFLIDRQGQVIAGGAGAQDWASEAARTLVQRLLGNGRTPRRG
jgi:peroxiredoxin